MYKGPSGLQGGFGFKDYLNVVAEFISIKKVYTFSSIRDHIMPKNLQCSDSATK